VPDEISGECESSMTNHHMSLKAQKEDCHFFGMTEACLPWQDILFHHSLL
jgi:hypothetical protein